MDANSEDSIENYSPELLSELGLNVSRFRVDRKKLEEKIKICSSASNENAEDFFQRVMRETSTRISWPSKLKIGAKSKKDPHVKVVGTNENIEKAKTMILQVLDTKQKNRVTLKMDVSHSDHSYIIGKGGFKIQQVMEETGCHIHFPDSNRSSNTDKSNQVSIAGEAEGVQKAQKKIRELLPVVYMFELPKNVFVLPGHETTPALQHIQQTYSFNLTFKFILPGQILVTVRGCHRLIERLRAGVTFLMEYLTGKKSLPALGVMKTEIAPHFHPFVMGTDNANVQMIMNKTGATITFADPHAPPSPLFTMATSLSSCVPTHEGTVPTNIQVSVTKTSVLIEGSFDSVCAAWDELLKTLPLSLIFDLKEGQDEDTALINNLIEMHKVNITVRPKIRENVKSVIVKGPEYKSDKMFEIRKEILGIPINHPNANHPNSIQELLKSLIISKPDILGVLDELSAKIPPHLMEEIMKVKNNRMTAPAFQDQHLNGSKKTMNGNDQASDVWYKNRGDKQTNMYTSRISSQEFPPFLPPPRHYMHSSGSADEADSAYNSSANWSYSQTGSSKSSSLCSLSNDPFDSNDHKNGLYYPLQSCIDNSKFSPLAADYGSKKMMATKAMYEDVAGARTPTREWSGQGFSKSLPGYILAKDLEKKTNPMNDQPPGPKSQQLNRFAAVPEYRQTLSVNHQAGFVDQACALDYSPKPSASKDQGVPSPFSLSNVWESVTPSNVYNYNNIKSLQQLFSFCDLDQYLPLFEEQEIDLGIFLTLTDFDLRQLNINFAARRKMLNAMAAMREAKVDFSGPSFKVAPGAERKSFSRLSSTDT